jgi:hypothetical protein
MPLRMPLQDLDQGRCPVRAALLRTVRRLPECIAMCVPRRHRRPGDDRAQQVARRFRRAQHLVAEANVERLFDARQQFHARQAVESEVLVQHAIERRPRVAADTHFGDQRIDDEQQLRRAIGRRNRILHALNRRAAGADFFNAFSSPSTPACASA